MIPDCTHRPPCPGCPRYGESPIPERSLGMLADLADHCDLSAPETVTGAGLGSRSRARLMVRGRARSPKIGIFEQGSHRIVDIPKCGIHHTLINEMAAAAKAAIFATGARPYLDATHQGLVRAIQVVVADESPGLAARAQVVVVTNSETSEPARELLTEIEARCRDFLHSLHWNGQPEQSNTIIGPLWQVLAGPAVLEDRSRGARVFYPPGAFGQANREMAALLVERVSSWVPSGSRVAEFYAGVGAIGLSLVEGAEHLYLNEIGEHSLAGLELGIRALPPEHAAKAQVHPGDAAGCLEMLDGCDTAIVDPPRRGLNALLSASLARWDGDRIVYVSCGVDSYIADARALIESGRWRLAEQVAYGFFPFTQHVETLARFERV